jgi:hypothetical protein
VQRGARHARPVRRPAPARARLRAVGRPRGARHGAGDGLAVPDVGRAGEARAAPVPRPRPCCVPTWGSTTRSSRSYATPGS